MAFPSITEWLNTYLRVAYRWNEIVSIKSLACSDIQIWVLFCFLWLIPEAGKLHQIEVSVLPRLNTNNNPEGNDLPTWLAGSRQRGDQSTDLLTPQLTLLARCPRAGTPHHLQLCRDGNWRGMESKWVRGPQNIGRYASWRKARFQFCNERSTSVTLEHIGFIYLSYPHFLLSTHQSATSGRLCSPVMEELPMNVYSRYHNMFIKPSVFKRCMRCHEFQSYRGHWSNEESSAAQSVTGMERRSPFLHGMAFIRHRSRASVSSEDISRALTFRRNSGERS